MIHENPCTLDELTWREIEQTITVNLLPAVNLIHMLLPGMKRRHRGIIVNVSSATGLHPHPFVAVYGSTKAFLNRFSEALQLELRGTGVECQLVYPMFVDTNLVQQWESMGAYSVASAPVQRYCRMAVWTIGKAWRTTGYWAHGLQVYGSDGKQAVISNNFQITGHNRENSTGFPSAAFIGDLS